MEASFDQKGASSSSSLDFVDQLEMDQLVRQYLQEGSTTFSCAEQVHAALCAGDARRALDIITAQCPALLQDQRLLFKLRKQQFIDLAQSGRPEELQQALALAKAELAPLALHAYPEAFTEFKHSMLLLLHMPAVQRQPGASTASSSLAVAGTAEADRQELAGRVRRTIREALGVRDPAFTVVLRYLLLVYMQHAAQQPAPGPRAAAAGGSAQGVSGTGGPMPQQEGSNEAEAAASGAQQGSGSGESSREDLGAVCKGLLLAQRDPMPLVPMSPELLRAPEAEVQALRNSLGCDREEALALMRHARGAKRIALRNAVQAAHLDDAAVLQLAQDYALFRGLDVPLPDLQQLQKQPAAQPSVDDAVPMDTAGGSPPAAPADSAPAALAQPAAAAMELSGQQAQTQALPLGMPTSGQEAGPLAAKPLPAAEVAAGGAPDAHAPPAKVPRAGGRRSPRDSSCSQPAAEGAAAGEAGMEGSLLGGASGSGSGAMDSDSGGQQEQQSGGSEGAVVSRPSQAPAQQQGSAPPAPTMGEREVHRLVKQMRGLLEAGQSEEVEEQLGRVSPGFAEQHPDAVFLARRCRFLYLLKGPSPVPGPAAAPGPGATPSPAAALAFARQRLSPLAQGNPALQPLLKSCLAALLPTPGCGLPATAAAPAAGASARAVPPAQAAAVEELREAAGVAAAAVHAALRQQFSIQEPRLLGLLGHLLVSHSAYFLAQRCKDSFEAELGIPQLRGPGVQPAAEEQWRAARRLQGPGRITYGPRAAAERAAALEDGLFGHMSPIFRRLQRIVGELQPAQPGLAANAAGAGGGPAVAGEEGGPPAGAQGGEAEGAAVPTGDMEHYLDEEESEEEEEDDGYEPAAGTGEGGAQGEEGEEGGPSEEAILLTQEFSGLPRGQAIELLLLFGGSPQAVMAHLFP